MKVTISKKELEELKDAQHKLSCLEAGGVDNWEWYSESLKGYWKEKEFEEIFNDALEDIETAITEGAYEPSERGAGFCASSE